MLQNKFEFRQGTVGDVPGVIQLIERRIEWMDRKGMETISQFKGILNVNDPKGVNTFERTQFLKYFGKKE